MRGTPGWIYKRGHQGSGWIHKRRYTAHAAFKKRQLAAAIEDFVDRLIEKHFETTADGKLQIKRQSWPPTAN